MKKQTICRIGLGCGLKKKKNYAITEQLVIFDGWWIRWLWKEEEDLRIKVKDRSLEVSQ